ncbi:hypothetical protein [Mesorhizobium sp. Z1-4]|uniref:hypothetical protein n=1 Tax=Mesorhizobium sp. Z1-4 TaxID=2448478 RepID=UPI000FD744EC|nr:hypothetical protein [Mesorhizobium sp. Z1-4]
MANYRREPVSYRPFRADPILSEGLLAVHRPGGELLEQVAQGFFRLAAEAGAVADDQVQRRFTQAGERAGVSGAPDIAIKQGRRPQGPRPSSPAGGARAASQIQTSSALPQSFLDAVDRSEGGGDYDTLFGHAQRAGGRFAGTRVSQMTIGQAMAFANPGGEYAQSVKGQIGRVATPMGRHQIVGTTLRTTVGKMGLDPNAPFDKGAQDAIAAHLARARVASASTMDGKIAALRSEWEGFKNVSRADMAQIVNDIENGVGSAGGGDVRFAVSGGGFVPMTGDTLAARSYNEAGARRYLQVLDTEVLSTTSQVYDLYSDDPATLERALGALKSELFKDHVIDEIAADFEVRYGQLANRYMEQARGKLQKRLEAEDRAAFIERTDTLSTDIARRIERLDPDNPSGGELLAATLGELDGHYDSAVERGILTPEAAANAKAKARSSTAVSFYSRQARERSAEDIAAMREAMRADFAEGRLDGVDADGWTLLEAELSRLEDGARTRDTKAAAALNQRAAAQLKRIEAGFDPDPEEINRLKLDQAGTPEGAQIVETAQRVMEAATVLRDSPLPAAQKYVEELRKRTGRNASDADIAVLAYAEERLAELQELVTKDPVGYEIATGRLELTPLALDGEDAELAASLAARQSEMRAVAETYGRPIEILRPTERTALARMMTEDPRQMPRLAKAMREALGADAGAALAEIAPEAPALAHAAGVSLATGNDGFMEEIAETLAAKAKGEFKLKMPNADKFATAAGGGFARALSFLGGTRQAAMQTAQLVFEREANLLGFDPDDIGKEGTPAAAAWHRALNRALGARFHAGRQTGGLAEVNGLTIVAPAGMDIETPQRLISGLTDDQLAQLPPIASANDIEVTAADIRRAFLSSAGDGRYRVALGDPLGFDPQWVVGADGDFWTLDLNALEDIRGNGGWSFLGWRSSP